jgi:hypothetical protein
MHIHFERTGGFTGLRLSATFDSASFSDEERVALRNLLEDARFFNLPASLDSPGGADSFQYRLTVEDQDRQHSLQASEGAVPDSLWPLLRWLTTKAIDVQRSRR